jgi:uncharacterized membrane protein YfcA
VFEILTIYLILGAIAGLTAGLLGVGGGLIIVPALASIFIQMSIQDTMVMHLAIGTSLATIVVTSGASMISHHRHAAIRWEIFWRLAPGIVVGAWFAAWLAGYLPDTVLKRIFGIFELVIAVQMGLASTLAARRSLPNDLGLIAAGTGIGCLSALLGIGGGSLTVPFLTWCRVTIHQAVATSAACGLPIALAGCIGYMVLGLNQQSLPAMATGYVYWPSVLGICLTSVIFAPIGARLTHRLPTKRLQGIFALFLAFLGVWMLVS